MTDRVWFGFENSYARMPERMYARVSPVGVARPDLIRVNAGLAEELGLDAAALGTGVGVAVLAGNAVAEGSEPVAMAYAGHQFGHFVPQLGDGRACLLGEVVGRDGKRRDIQLKGSGRTPFSRGGDGRAAVGPVVREYVVSEAMAALGVPTTRALAAVTTGELVYREGALPGAVLTRVAASHLRVGTFQYFAARGDVEALRLLVGYALERHYPEVEVRTAGSLLAGVIGRQARLVAQWMGLGFVHGVMNTDNMTISGETIDYGPCAFLEAYEPGKVFSSIDAGGRYAYGNQANAALWNLARLAEALLPVMAEELGGPDAALAEARARLAEFEPEFHRARLAGLRAKLGLATEQEGDAELAEDWLERMARGGVDFTLGFRRLADAAEGNSAGVRGLFSDGALWDGWAERWRDRLGVEGRLSGERAAGMRRVSPAYIPRNHRVEAAIQAGMRGDFGVFEELLEVVTHPWEERAGWEAYMEPARAEERVERTFCGT